MATSHEIAFSIATMLAEHKGGSVVLLDLAEQSGFTDWFVIATASSVAHLRGLARFTQERAYEFDLQPRMPGSIHDEEEWVLLDLGDVVVHLMTERARQFYELEKLWFQAKATSVEVPAGGK